MSEINVQYGRLKVLSHESNKAANGKFTTICKCQCDCGNTVEVSLRKLKKGDTRSCGCYFSGRSKAKSFKTWGAMKTRCFNIKADNYGRYGGKGIVVCSGFLSYKFFIDTVGAPPTDKHTIDRINSSGNYSCGECKECIENNWSMNCRWLTNKDQQRNKSSNHFILVDNKKMCISDAAKYLGIPRLTLSSRITSYGWDLKKAISEPVREKVVLHLETGTFYSLISASRTFNIPNSKLRYGLNKNKFTHLKLV